MAWTSRPRGAAQTSPHPALSNLLNAIGDSLKPKITAVIHPANNGAGIPAGGLFSPKDLKKHGHEANTLFGKLKTESGVIEVKPLDKDLSSFEFSGEVRTYSNENFPLPVVSAIRALGHDVLTSNDADKANEAIPDDEVLRFATKTNAPSSPTTARTSSASTARTPATAASSSAPLTRISQLSPPTFTPTFKP